MPTSAMRLRPISGRGFVAASALALLGLLFVLAPSARANAGRLDPTFSRDGRAFTPPGTAGEGASVELSIAPDGSTVVANAIPGTVVRFLSDGSRDTAFGAGGELVVGYEAAAEGQERFFHPWAVALDSLGRVLVFGEQADLRSFNPGGFSGSVSASLVVVLRFTGEGQPDPSFGEGRGFIRSDFGLGSGLRTELPMVGAIAGRVDSRNRPVFVAGVSTAIPGCYAHGGVGTRPRAVVRLTESGQPDPSFGGGDGLSPIEGSTDFPNLQIDSEDRLVVGVGRVGGVRAECEAGTTLFRLRVDGQRLAGFGSNGVRVLKRLHLAVLEPSGAMVVSRKAKQVLRVARLRPNGDRAVDFGRHGLARIHLPFGSGSYVRPVAVDGRGRILLAGFVGSPIGEPSRRRPNSYFLVGRLLRSGKLDQGFGHHGWVATRFPRPLIVTSVQATLDPRGRLLVAGTVATPKQRDGGFVLARYLLGR